VVVHRRMDFMDRLRLTQRRFAQPDAQALARPVVGCHDQPSVGARLVSQCFEHALHCRLFYRHRSVLRRQYDPGRMAFRPLWEEFI